LDYLSQLNARKQEIEEALTHSREYLQAQPLDATGEHSWYDQGSDNNASEMYLREKTAGMAELLEIELEKTNKAIERYYSNQYGLCEECGQPIETARLNTAVNAALCSRCARQGYPESFRSNDQDTVWAATWSDPGHTYQVTGYELNDR
jgi:RNA polymerase-binding transcription factor DksA